MFRTFLGKMSKKNAQQKAAAAPAAKATASAAKKGGGASPARVNNNNNNASAAKEGASPKNNASQSPKTAVEAEKNAAAGQKSKPAGKNNKKASAAQKKEESAAKEGGAEKSEADNTDNSKAAGEKENAKEGENPTKGVNGKKKLGVNSIIHDLKPEDKLPKDFRRILVLDHRDGKEKELAVHKDSKLGKEAAIVQAAYNKKRAAKERFWGWVQVLFLWSFCGFLGFKLGFFVQRYCAENQVTVFEAMQHWKDEYVQGSQRGLTYMRDTVEAQGLAAGSLKLSKELAGIYVNLASAAVLELCNSIPSLENLQQFGTLIINKIHGLRHGAEQPVAPQPQESAEEAADKKANYRQPDDKDFEDDDL